MENLQNWNFLKTLLTRIMNTRHKKSPKICIQCKVIEAESYLGISVSRVACHPQAVVLGWRYHQIVSIEDREKHCFKNKCTLINNWKIIIDISLQVIGNLDLMEMEHILLALKLKPLKLCKIMDPSICTVLLVRFAFYYTNESFM